MPTAYTVMGDLPKGRSRASERVPAQPATGPGRALRVLTSASDGANPFVRLLHRAIAGTGRVSLASYSKHLAASGWADIWHLNWPEHAYQHPSIPIAWLKALKLLAQLSFARGLGTRIVLTVHNLTPHQPDHRSLAPWFWRSFDRRVDLFVHLSSAGQNMLLEAGRGSRRSQHLALWHPRYEVMPTDIPGRAQARAALDLASDSLVLATTGRLAANKGIAPAVRCVCRLDDSRLRFIIAGEPDTPDTLDSIFEATAGDDRISIHPGFVDDEEVIGRTAAADLVLLPYRSFLNSGALLHALSVGRPVLVPSTPVTDELAAIVGRHWVRTYAGELEPTAILEALKDLPREDETPNLSQLSWEGFASELLCGYEDVLAHRRKRSVRMLRRNVDSTSQY